MCFYTGGPASSTPALFYTRCPTLYGVDEGAGEEEAGVEEEDLIYTGNTGVDDELPV